MLGLGIGYEGPPRVSVWAKLRVRVSRKTSRGVAPAPTLAAAALAPAAAPAAAAAAPPAATPRAAAVGPGLRCGEAGSSAATAGHVGASSGPPPRTAGEN